MLTWCLNMLGYKAATGNGKTESYFSSDQPIKAGLFFNSIKLSETKMEFILFLRAVQNLIEKLITKVSAGERQG